MQSGAASYSLMILSFSTLIKYLDLGYPEICKVVLGLDDEKEPLLIKYKLPES